MIGVPTSATRLGGALSLALDRRLQLFEAASPERTVGRPIGLVEGTARPRIAARMSSIDARATSPSTSSVAD
jgi:hypothetical protein